MSKHRALRHVAILGCAALALLYVARRCPMVPGGSLPGEGITITQVR